MIRWDHHQYTIFINVICVRLLVSDVYIHDQDIINDNYNLSTKIKVSLSALDLLCSRAYNTHRIIIYMYYAYGNVYMLIS
jgi:hypothetical protein